jgi:DNA-binding LacI/PurR family transcriptional regulator
LYNIFDIKHINDIKKGRKMDESHIVYKRIEKYIIGLIESRTVAQGDFLPPEREIAKKFGASQFPVRQAIRNLTVKGILRNIPARGTSINMKPRGKRNVKTGRIAVLYSFHDENFLSDSFYSAIFNGLNGEAQKRDRSPLLHSLKRAPGSSTHETISRLCRDVDGLIFIDPAQDDFRAAEQVLRQNGKPAVALNYDGPSRYMDTVVFDNEAGARAMTDFLLACGHRRIGFVCITPAAYYYKNQQENPVYLKRLKGYRDSLEAAGAGYDEQLVATLRHAQDAESFRRLLGQPQPPTALFCFGDATALSVYQLAAQLSLAIPDDLSVVGFDGVKEAEIAVPPLTTVSTPLTDMGRAGVRRILECEEEGTAGRLAKIVLSGSIVERKSHAKIATV